MSRRFREFREDVTSDYTLLGPPLFFYGTSFPLANFSSGPELKKSLLAFLRALLMGRFKNGQARPAKRITTNYLNMAEGKGKAAAKSAPSNQVFVENVARARTAHHALMADYELGADRAIDAVRTHRPDFPWRREW